MAEASNWPVRSASSLTSEARLGGTRGSRAPQRLRLATRSSPLALWQAGAVSRLLCEAHPQLVTETVPIHTEGDHLAEASLADIGGRGVFVGALQAAVLDGRADAAVHSAKDLPSVTPAGLCIAAVPRRSEARDALVGCRLADLPSAGRVATGSARRRVQLAERRPDLRFVDLRGNIDTRLAKSTAFDAVVMALAALERLGRRPGVLEPLEVEVMVPQAGQGALAVECRSNDHQVRELLAKIEDSLTRRCVDAERAFLAALGGDCMTPAAAHASPAGEQIQLQGMLEPAKGELLRRATVSDRDPARAGAKLLKVLLKSGELPDG